MSCFLYIGNKQSYFSALQRRLIPAFPSLHLVRTSSAKRARALLKNKEVQIVFLADSQSDSDCLHFISTTDVPCPIILLFSADNYSLLIKTLESKKCLFLREDELDTPLLDRQGGDHLCRG